MVRGGQGGAREKVRAEQRREGGQEGAQEISGESPMCQQSFHQQQPGVFRE